MTFAVIVQARAGSSRLPGKVLEPLGDKSVLAHCLDRCAQVPGVDFVVCAVPEGTGDDAVAAEAARCGAVVTRGSETDVLSRYSDAAAAVRADVVMRVTSDCPVFDPALGGAVRDLLVSSRADYAANTLPPAFPHGLDCDVFPAALLHRAAEEAMSPYEREHVTPWLRTHTGLKKAALVGPGGGVERLRWTLDTSEDLAFLRALAEKMGPGFASAGWRDLAAACADTPGLTDINANQIDEARLATAGHAGLPVHVRWAA